MKFHKCRIIAYLCLAALLLAGCSKEVNFGPGAMGSEVWEQWPTLTYGTMETEKLAVLPWNSGRCEATTYNVMAETENGYYFIFWGYLYYADKADLSKWVLVCSKPECKHREVVHCNARIGHRIIVKNDRLYYEEKTGESAHLYSTLAAGEILVSTAPDGTDKQLVYVLEEALVWAGASSQNTMLSPGQWLYSVASLGLDGNVTTKFFRVTEDGVTEYPITKEEYAPVGLGWAGESYLLFGDPYFYNSALGDTNEWEDRMLYRFEGDTLIELDPTKILYTGGYISGSTIRCLRYNDGYYDINIDTEEEVKLADPRLENSYGVIMLPNCIVESTLWYVNIKDRTEDMTHSVEIFDGESWRSVKLPEEVATPKDTEYITVQAVTSDSIFIVFRDRNKEYSEYISLYRIPIGSEELVMEYCGDIKLPKKDKDQE